MKQLDAVTGAYGFSGKYIAGKLLEKGHRVITLTNSFSRENPFQDKVTPYPFHFNQPRELVKALKGVSVLYNTYWVRFNHKSFNHNSAVENTIKLFQAAREAGVKRIVHVSITNPSEESKLEYFHGKAVLERKLKETGISYSILRPAIIFGKEDILINNITWMLRRLPVFPVFGYGSYRVQPIYVEDLAELAVREGSRSLEENKIINAIGPETFTFRGLIEKIGDIIGVNKPIISVSPSLAYCVSFIISKLVGDVVITKEEITGLMADLLCVDTEPTGDTKLSDWVKRNKERLGKKYANELTRRANRRIAYVH